MSSINDPEALMRRNKPYFANIYINTSNGLKLYTKATEEPSNEEEYYDFSQEKSRYFVQMDLKASTDFNWGPAFTEVPEDIGTDRSMLQEYTQLTVAYLKSKAN